MVREEYELIMSADLYLLPDTPWMTIVAVVWGVVALAVAIVFLIMLVKRRGKFFRTALLGVVAVGLVVGGFVVQIGQTIYPDSDGQWVCPSGINAIQITEAPGRALPEGIQECRSDARRNVTLGLLMAGAGFALTIGNLVATRKSDTWTRIKD